MSEPRLIQIFLAYLGEKKDHSPQHFSQIVLEEIYTPEVLT